MEATEFKVKDLLEATGAVPSLSDREKHLIGLAVTVTRGCSVCTGGRIEQAIAAGIDYEAVRAAIDLTAAVNAGVAIRTAIEGASARGIEPACDDNLCTAGVGNGSQVAS